MLLADHGPMAIVAGLVRLRARALHAASMDCIAATTLRVRLGYRDGMTQPTAPRAKQQRDAAATGAPSASDDHALLAALREGDDDAFSILIDRYHASLVRIATLFVPDHGVAEEVAQETWIGVLRGIDRFEGRSSFRTWLFGILANQAKRRGERERRMVPFSALTRSPDGAEPAVEPERFFQPGEEYPGYWASPPSRWELPETAFLAGEAREEIERAVAALPPNQRAVITMRDVEGWSAAEVRNILSISDTNQRVLLHRARSKVRRELERYVAEGLGSGS
jgi:RNA polymerase sigma-70 factor, ECF subfamily